MANHPVAAAPTLRDIARRAGVSHTTVALALRGDPVLPERTRRRVGRLAEAMGYRPNPLVTALMTQVRARRRSEATEVIGLLTGGPTADNWRQHSAAVGFYDGALRRAAELGLRVEPFWLGPDGQQAEHMTRVLRARSIRGSLIVPFPAARYPEPLAWAEMVCVALGYAYPAFPLHRATHHHFRGSFAAVENLVLRGYRRIGLMLEETENTRVGYAWLGGYLAAREMAGLPPLAPLLTTPRTAVAEARRWLAAKRPDAVIGFGPMQVKALEAAGGGVADGVGFAALDVEQTRLAGRAGISGIDQNLPLIGATAIDILVGRLYHNERGLPQRPVLSMVEGVWVDGKTAPVRG